MGILPRITAQLVVTGNTLDSDEFSKSVGLLPTRTWRAGDLIGSSILRRKSHGWVLGVPPRRTFDTDECVKDLLAALGPNAGRLRAALAHNLDIAACVSCSGYFVDTVPSVCIAAELIDQIAALGASLDVDLIACSLIADDQG